LPVDSNYFPSIPTPASPVLMVSNARSDIARHALPGVAGIPIRSSPLPV